MANRYFDTEFWRDPYTSTLDVVEKCLFMYCLLNPATNIAGIYKQPLKVIAAETGIDIDSVKNIFGRFENEKKIFYKDGWVIIKNFPKYQTHGTNPKIKAGIEKIIAALPQDILQYSISIGYAYDSNYLNSNINTNINTNSNVKSDTPSTEGKIDESKEKSDQSKQSESGSNKKGGGKKKEKKMIDPRIKPFQLAFNEMLIRQGYPKESMNWGEVYNKVQLQLEDGKSIEFLLSLLPAFEKNEFAKSTNYSIHLLFKQMTNYVPKNIFTIKEKKIDEASVADINRIMKEANSK